MRVTQAGVSFVLDFQPDRLHALLIKWHAKQRFSFPGARHSSADADSVVPVDGGTRSKIDRFEGSVNVGMAAAANQNDERGYCKHAPQRQTDRQR